MTWCFIPLYNIRFYIYTKVIKKVLSVCDVSFWKFNRRTEIRVYNHCTWASFYSLQSVNKKNVKLVSLKYLTSVSGENCEILNRNGRKNFYTEMFFIDFDFYICNECFIFVSEFYVYTKLL